MKILPDEAFQLESSLAPDKALDRLASKLDDGEFIRDEFIGTPSAQAFEGSISGGTFKIRRISWLFPLTPKLQGTIEPAGSGSRILIHMTLNRFRRISLIMWYGWVTLGVSIVVLPVELTAFSPILLLLALLVLLLCYGLGYGVELAWLKFEGSKARKSLNYLFAA